MIGRRIARDKAPNPDDVAGQHAVLLAEQLGDREVGALRHAELARHRGELGRRVLGGALDRMAHMKQRARAERAHVVRRHVGVRMDDPDAFGRNIERLADNLRHRGVGALAHVDRAAIEHAAAVSQDVDHCHRRGRRDRCLEADGDAAPAPHRPAAALERRVPFHPRRHALEHLVDRGIAHHGAGRLRAAVAQDVAAAEFDGIELERARHQVGVALVGPYQLRNAEAA